MSEERRVQIPVVAIGAALLWLTAVGLLGWETWTPGRTTHGQWALLASAAAASWTVIAGQCLGRRKLAERIVRKLEVRQEETRLSRI